MMDIYELSIVFMVTIFLFLCGFLSQINDRRRLQRIIERQNDTIQRLINREPVTYAEVGAKPQKPVRETYAAWGNQMVNIDEDERQ